MTDELSRIARIRTLLQARPGHHATGVALGIGDDAAVLAPLSGSLVLSVDASVEHVHFERAFASLDVIGERAFSAALSDLAAMGASPRAALSALVLPSGLLDDELDTLVSGLARGAEHYRCPIVGGNLSRGAELSLTTTVIGEAHGAALTRAGAKPGDAVHVTGTLGGAALGLLLLQAGEHAGPARAFTERWQRPCARIAEGEALRGHATAAIDVSDGALQDLSQLCAASGVGADVDAGRLPLAEGFAELARRHGRDPAELALAGGEDYELIYTLAQGATDPAQGTRIGTITDQPGRVLVRDEAGAPIELRTTGHQHFR